MSAQTLSPTRRRLQLSSTAMTTPATSDPMTWGSGSETDISAGFTLLPATATRTSQDSGRLANRSRSDPGRGTGNAPTDLLEADFATRAVMWDGSAVDITESCVTD